MGYKNLLGLCFEGKKTKKVQLLQSQYFPDTVALVQDSNSIKANYLIQNKISLHIYIHYKLYILYTAAFIFSGSSYLFETPAIDNVRHD